MHTCYVYGAKIWPDPSGSATGTNLIIATACFDQYVRFWNVKTDGSDHNREMEPVKEESILTKPSRTLGAKQSIYEAD
jgi:hypothetical protein